MCNSGTKAKCKIPHFPCLPYGQLLSHPGMSPDLFASAVTQTAGLKLKTSRELQRGGNRHSLKHLIEFLQAPISPSIGAIQTMEIKNANL